MNELKKMLKNDIINDTEELLIENKLNELFDLDKENREDRVGMHGSGIIASDNEFCVRQHVLSFFFKGVEAIHSSGLKRIFLEGWSIHEKWQMLFKKAGIALGIEQRGYSNEWNLLFTPDAIVKIGNKTYVVEIKSVNTFLFKKMKSHPSAEKQLQLYMHFTGIPHGFVLCEDKNSQDIKVYVYEYDPIKAKPYVERMLKVIDCKKKYIKTGKLPKRICENENCKKACNCAYKNACYNIEKIPIDNKKYKQMKEAWDE